MYFLLYQHKEKFQPLITYFSKTFHIKKQTSKLKNRFYTWNNSAVETYNTIHTSSPNISIFWVTKMYSLSGKYQYFKEHAVFVFRLISNISL
jgi:hypothetical protein